jgi:cytochrome P450
MRLFPTSLSARRCGTTSCFRYEGRDYPIDHKLAIVPNTHGVHYDESYFPDAAEFRPERFMDRSEKDSSEGPWSLAMPFGSGKRACTGKNLALEEVKVLLLMIVRSYDFECAETPNPKPRAPYTRLDTVFGNVVFQQFGIAARPGGDVLMRVRRRK